MFTTLTADDISNVGGSLNDLGKRKANEFNVTRYTHSDKHSPGFFLKFNDAPNGESNISRKMISNSKRGQMIRHKAYI